MQALVPQRPQVTGNYQRVAVTSNHFNFGLGNLRVYRYCAEVQSNSTLDENSIIQEMLERYRTEIEEEIGEIFSSGNLVYSFRPLNQRGSIRVGNSDSTMTITPSGRPLSLQELANAPIGDKEETQKFLNVVIKSWVQRFGYFEFGHSGRYFRFDREFGRVNDSLMVLQGFKVSFELYENSTLKVLIDYCTRVISRITLWDQFLQLSPHDVDQQKVANKAIGGRMYLNTCGPIKLVRIHGLDLNLTPASPCPIEGYATYRDYFEQEYGVVVREEDQYLAYCMTKVKTRTAQGEELTTKKKKYYLPEFLVGTGMSDREKQNFRLMNTVSTFTKLTPRVRMPKIYDFARDMNTSNYNPLGLNINLTQNQVEGIILQTPTILRCNGKKTHSILPKRGNFFLEKQVLEECNIKKWTCVYEDQDYDYCEEFVDLLRTSARNNGFNMAEPDWVEMSYHSSKGEYTQAIKNAYTTKSQFILFLLPERNLNRSYRAFQKLTKVKYPILCQGVKTQTKYLSPKMRRGIGDKIVTQIYTKLGYSPWKVQIPEQCKKDAQGMMIIGADVFHNRGKNSVAAVVGTTNGEFTKYCSDFRIQARGQEIMNNVASSVITCIEGYRKANKRLPKKVLFYRDGVGEGQKEIVKREEIEKIKKSLGERYGAKCPKLTMVLVTKRINDRFFTKDVKRGLDNPQNGLIVYSDVVKTDWEFFMVAQKVNQGSAAPTRYQVLHDENGIGADSLFNMTYSQCYNYYNWTGAVKVPAVCQLAHTLAYFAGENLKENVHPRLFNHLYFL